MHRADLTKPAYLPFRHLLQFRDASTSAAYPTGHPVHVPLPGKLYVPEGIAEADLFVGQSSPEDILLNIDYSAGLSYCHTWWMDMVFQKEQPLHSRRLLCKLSNLIV